MRSKKAFLNFISGLLLQFVTAFVALILPRLYIQVYGSEINGLVTSIRQFLSYLTIVEAGVGAASIAALYLPIALGDKKGANNILAATKIFYKKSGYLFSFLVITLAVVYPHFVNGEVRMILAFSMVLALGLSGILEYLIIGKYQVMLIADQKSYIVNMVQITEMILNVSICTFMIQAGFDVLAVQIICAFVYITRIVMILLYMKKNYKDIHFEGEPNFSAIGMRWDALIHQVVALVVFSTPFVILTLFNGLKDVSVFAIYSLVINGVIMFVSAFSNGLMATFGEILAKGERKTLIMGFDNFEFLYFLIMSWAYTCTALLYLPFISIYTANVEDINYVRPMVATLFIFLGVVSCIRMPYMMLVHAAGHYKQTKYRAIIEALLNISLSLTLVQFLGMEGVVVASILSHIYRNIDVIGHTSRKILQRSVKATVIKLIRNFAFAIIAVLPFYMLLKIHISTWLSWFSWAILISLWVMLVFVAGNTITDSKNMLGILIRLKALIYGRGKADDHMEKIN